MTGRDEAIVEIHKPAIPVPARVTVWVAFPNRETKIGNVRRAMAGHPLPRFLVSVEFGKRRTTDLDSLMHEVRNDPDLVLWYRLPGIGRAGHRSESTWEPPSASQRACLIRQALFFP